VARKCKKRCVLTVLLLVTPFVVMAQNQEDSTPALEEIIVTATMREASTFDIPFSVSAISEEGLKRIGADKFGDYLATIPGIHFPDTGDGRSTIVTRGILLNDRNVSVEDISSIAQ